ncbi:MAG: hypothetical protein DYG88_05740 [Chloroflexi bacterium CFX4]|nr:hypothetical protein [Chloroflexi bacterium CFX4]MDL1924596.1 hypothetical protein [Chloroflexi bacterium CFX3]
MNPQRPFGHVPRRILNIVVIIVGVIGIFIANSLNWSGVQAFLLVSIMIIVGLFIIAGLYPKKG